MCGACFLLVEIDDEGLILIGKSVFYLVSEGRQETLDCWACWLQIRSKLLIKGEILFLFKAIGYLLMSDEQLKEDHSGNHIQDFFTIIFKQGTQKIQIGQIFRALKLKQIHTVFVGSYTTSQRIIARDTQCIPGSVGEGELTFGGFGVCRRISQQRIFPS